MLRPAHASSSSVSLSVDQDIRQALVARGTKWAPRWLFIDLESTPQDGRSALLNSPTLNDTEPMSKWFSIAKTGSSIYVQLEDNGSDT